MLLAGCGPLNAAAALTPKVLDQPAGGKVTAFEDLTLSSPDDPTHAHWWGHFGWTVDTQGDRMVTGEPCWGRPPGEGVGAAYVFRLSPAGKWELEASLAPGDRGDGVQVDPHFGAAIALEGMTLAVGAPGYDSPTAGDDVGAVYLYTFDGQAWVESGKLVSAHPAAGAGIGNGIALDGDTLAASGDPAGSSAVVFQRVGGEWQEAFEAQVPASKLGMTYVSVALRGDTLAVGTAILNPEPTGTPNEAAMIRTLKTSGSVTLYERTEGQWKKTYQTGALDIALYDTPHTLPVALGGSAEGPAWLAVGRPGFPGSGRDAGSVAIFTRGERGWQPEADLRMAAADPAPGEMNVFQFARTPMPSLPDVGQAFFGYTVKAVGDRLGVVAMFSNTAYILERQGGEWVYLYRVIPENFGDDFQRRTVALEGTRLVLGSPGDLGGGHVLVFTLPD
jgi:hypothetical protein